MAASTWRPAFRIQDLALKYRANEVHCAETSTLTEHLFWEPYCSWGPYSGTNSLENVIDQGLLPLFISCFAFLVPACVHWYCSLDNSNHRLALLSPWSRRTAVISRIDRYLAIVFAVVAVTSALCDVWWVASNEVNADSRRVLRGGHTRVTMYQRDCYSHLGLLVDRTTAAVLLAPPAVLFNVKLIWEQSGRIEAKLLHTVCFLGALVVALGFARMFKEYKSASYCYTQSFTYREHNMWHIMWHLLTATAFAWSRAASFRGDDSRKKVN